MKRILALAVLAVAWAGIKLVTIIDDLSMIGEDDPYE